MITVTRSIITFADRFAVELLVLSWQALVLVTFAWLSLRVAKVSAPVLRHHVWLLFLVAIFLLPVATPLVHSLPLVRPANQALHYVIEAPRAMIDPGPAAATQTRKSDKKATGFRPSVLASILPFALPLSF